VKARARKFDTDNETTHRARAFDDQEGPLRHVDPGLVDCSTPCGGCIAAIGRARTTRNAAGAERKSLVSDGGYTTRPDTFIFIMHVQITF